MVQIRNVIQDYQARQKQLEKSTGRGNLSIAESEEDQLIQNILDLQEMAKVQRFLVN